MSTQIKVLIPASVLSINHLPGLKLLQKKEKHGNEDRKSLLYKLCIKPVTVCVKNDLKEITINRFQLRFTHSASRSSSSTDYNNMGYLHKQFTGLCLGGAFERTRDRIGSLLLPKLFTESKISLCGNKQRPK